MKYQSEEEAMNEKKMNLTKENEEQMESAKELATRASAMVVTNQDAHTEASDVLVQLQTKKREIEDIREFQLEPIKKAKRAIEESRKRTIAFFQTPITVVVEVMGRLDGRMVSWRREERMKAEREAQRKRAAELKKIEEHRRQQENIAKSLEKKGLEEDAAEIRDRVEVTAPAQAPLHVAPRIVTVPGATVKIKKIAEVDEPLQLSLLQAAIDAYNANQYNANQEQRPGTHQIVPAAYWTLNLKALNAFGQKTDGQVVVPGVKWVEDESTQPRRRR